MTVVKWLLWLQFMAAVTVVVWGWGGCDCGTVSCGYSRHAV